MDQSSYAHRATSRSASPSSRKNSWPSSLGRSVVRFASRSRPPPVKAPERCRNMSLQGVGHQEKAVNFVSRSQDKSVVGRQAVRLTWCQFDLSFVDSVCAGVRGVVNKRCAVFLMLLDKIFVPFVGAFYCCYDYFKLLRRLAGMLFRSDHIDFPIGSTPRTWVLWPLMVWRL